MADTSIANLTAASTLTGTEEIPLSDGSGTTKACTAQQIKDFVETAPVFTAGSATAGSWPKLTAGTLQTTPDAGSIEMDANAIYMTHDAGNRGAVDICHYIRAASSRALSNVATEQAIFNSPTNGRITLEVGLYFFEGMLYLTGMSGTSGNAAFDIVGAGTVVTADWLWHAVGIDATTPTTAATQTGTFSITQQSAASMVTAGTGTAMGVNLRGTFEVATAGTLIPSVTLVTASAATVAAGSYVMLRRLGASNYTNVGQWD
jgi:hypothetical protein